MVFYLKPNSYGTHCNCTLNHSLLRFTVSKCFTVFNRAAKIGLSKKQHFVLRAQTHQRKACWEDKVKSKNLQCDACKGKVCIRTKWPISAGGYPNFLNIKRVGVFLLPLDKMLVHRRVTPSSKFAGTHLYTWVERGTMKVKYPVRVKNTTQWPGQGSNPDRSIRSAVHHASHKLTECDSCNSVISFFSIILYHVLSIFVFHDCAI